MPEFVTPLFRELPDEWKFVVFTVLFFVVVGYTAWTWVSWRETRHLKKELRRTQDALQAAETDRDELQARFEALDKVDNHVWKKPDRFEKNRFRSKSERSARFIAICNLKGGVGKTTLTLNLGITLALAGKRVLLVDLDFQGTLTNMTLDKAQRDEYRRNDWTTDALFDQHMTVDQARKLMFPVLDSPACRVMAAREKLEIVEFEEQSRFFVNPEHEVRFLLQRVLHAPEISQNYDYVFFDCPPRMSTACINALTCADYVLIPTTLSQLDIEAVPRTLNWLKELHSVVRAVFLGAIITRAKLRAGKLVSYERKQFDTLNQFIRQHQPGDRFIFSGIIQDSPIIHRMAGEQKAAAAHDEDIRGLFEAVAHELERKASV